jgi:hypothetical protein
MDHAVIIEDAHTKVAIMDHAVIMDNVGIMDYAVIMDNEDISVLY